MLCLYFFFKKNRNIQENLQPRYLLINLFLISCDWKCVTVVFSEKN